MAKAKSKKSLKQFQKSHKIILIAVVVVFLLLLGIQAILIKDLYKRTDSLGSEKIKTLIIEAVRNLENQPVTDIETGREYIPVARLVLPPRDEVVVTYSGDKETVQFSDRANVSQAIADIHNAQSYEDTFKKVPNLQACSRQIVLQLKQDSSEGLQLIHNKKLSDGRVLFFYENKECKGDSSTLANYLKQVESY